MRWLHIKVYIFNIKKGYWLGLQNKCRKTVFWMPLVVLTLKRQSITKYFSLFRCIIAVYSSSQLSSLAFIYICKKNKNESEIKYWGGLFYYGELQTIQWSLLRIWNVSLQWCPLYQNIWAPSGGLFLPPGVTKYREL